MASKHECDQYAAELNARFEQLTKWAIENWPKREFPLLSSDFIQSRREISEIVGPKLGDCCDQETSSHKDGDTARVVMMNPMPWP
jgi:hypothetical protein